LQKYLFEFLWEKVPRETKVKQIVSGHKN